jgi:tetratricopeptide (TPR) repeat protein
LQEARNAFRKLFPVYPDAIDVFAANLFRNEVELKTFGNKLEEAPNASIRFAVFLYRNGHKELAARQIEKTPEDKLVEMNPSWAGIILNDVGKADEALRILEKAWLGKDETDAWLGKNLADVYEQEGETEKALQIWRAVLKQSPGNPEWNIGVARVAHKGGKPELALRHYHKVTVNRDAQGRYRKKAYLGIAKIKKEQNKYKEARQAYEMALELDPGNEWIKKQLEKLRDK